MKFGRQLKRISSPWKAHFVDYGKLKKILNHSNCTQPFFEALDAEITKAINFYSLKETDYAERFNILSQERILIKGKRSNLSVTSHNSPADVIITLFFSLTDLLFHTQQLLFFSKINLEATEKILKKYEKRVGQNPMASAYLQRLRASSLVTGNTQLKDITEKIETMLRDIGIGNNDNDDSDGQIASLFLLVDELYNTIKQESDEVILSSAHNPSLLRIAAEVGHSTLLALLLEKRFLSSKPLLPIQDIRLRSPLHFAAYGGYSDCVSLLIDDINRRDKSNPESIDSYNTSPLDERDIDGATPLLLACLKGNISCVSLLIENGADPNISDVQSRTPLHIAASYGNAECLAILLNGKKRGIVNIRDGSGRSPLHHSCKSGSTDCVRLLIESGAEVMVLDDEGRYPIHEAVLGGNLETLKLIVSNSPSSSVNSEDNEGRVPLHDACFSNQTEIVRYLLESGATLHVVDKDGWSPFALAVYRGFLQLAQALDYYEENNSFPTIEEAKTNEFDFSLLRRQKPMVSEESSIHHPLLTELNVSTSPLELQPSPSIVVLDQPSNNNNPLLSSSSSSTPNYLSPSSGISPESASPYPRSPVFPSPLIPRNLASALEVSKNRIGSPRAISHNVLTKVTFVVRANIPQTHCVKVVGNRNALGRWDPLRAVPLALGNQADGAGVENVWSTTIVVPADVPLEYRYIVCQKHRLEMWETLPSNRVIQPHGANYLVDDGLFGTIATSETTTILPPSKNSNNNNNNTLSIPSPLLSSTDSTTIVKKIVQGNQRQVCVDQGWLVKDTQLRVRIGKPTHTKRCHHLTTNTPHYCKSPSIVIYGTSQQDIERSIYRVSISLHPYKGGKNPGEKSTAINDEGGLTPVQLNLLDTTTATTTPPPPNPSPPSSLSSSTANLPSGSKPSPPQEITFGTAMSDTDLPFHEVVFQGHHANPQNMSIAFDVLRNANGTSPMVLIGKAIAIPPQMPEDSMDSMCTVPIMAPHSQKVIGEITFQYVTLKPFLHKNISLGSTYWKTTLLIGHRGSGAENAQRYQSGSFRRSHVKENTILSFITASSLGAQYVEFDVHLTKDLVPVIYHDFVYKIPPGVPVPISQMPLKIFKELHNYQVSHEATTEAQSHKKTPPGSPQTRPRSRSAETPPPLDNVKIFIQDTSLPTLEELFKKCPPNLGFNVEIKYPVPDQASLGLKVVDRNTYVDRILQVVFDNAKDRPILFSSFDPDVCLYLSLKQPTYPVCLLTEAGTYITSDPRFNSIYQAVQFAKQSHLLGLVIPSLPLLLAPAIIHSIKEDGMLLLTWGRDNNDPSNVTLQENLGVDAIILDHVAHVARHLVLPPLPDQQGD
eukprot:TRINITY_DN3639_c0_g1_i1.p1 TRINITY_DN3639_c0_g1~~TRINITY_DN3639_c0_g1_i1.p1  ORF type:complete len:1340 (-),score=321.57 TRINITY_DN3639_c0_g1_i1:88-4107(-)